MVNNMSNIPIFLSSDNNYAPFVATTIASICDNTESFVDIYILDGGISKENQKKILKVKEKFSNLSLKFIEVNVDRVFKNIKTKNHLSLSAYSRLLIPKLKPQIDKAIYLDVDIIVCSDIKELFDFDLGGYIIGAIPDQGRKEHIERTKALIDMQPSSIYFNSGVLLLDCLKWRKEVKFEDLIDIEEKYREVRLHNDQDVLNKYFENNYLVLSKEYNVMYSNDVIKIRHFTGQIKPWNASFYLDGIIPHKIQNAELFWKYALMTPYYDVFLRKKEDFLNSNMLYKRFSKIVERG